MTFNLDLTKKAQAIFFSENNEAFSEHSVSKKHLGLHLDQKLILVNTLMKKSLKYSKENQSLKAL